MDYYIYLDKVEPILSDSELARIVEKYVAVYTEDSSHVPQEL